MLEWLAAFALSQAVEVPLVVWLLGRPTAPGRPGARRPAPPVGRPRARAALLALAATTLTHPFVWFLFPRLGLTYAAYVWSAELFAWLAETAFYTLALPLRWERALLVSLAANASSALLGTVLSS